MPTNILNVKGEYVSRMVLSRAVGIDVGHISRIFSHQRGISYEAATKISAYLGFSIDEFCTRYIGMAPSQLERMPANYAGVILPDSETGVYIRTQGQPDAEDYVPDSSDSGSDSSDSKDSDSVDVSSSPSGASPLPPEPSSAPSEASTPPASAKPEKSKGATLDDALSSLLF